MADEKHKTSAYKIIPTQYGNRYSFFVNCPEYLSVPPEHTMQTIRRRNFWQHGNRRAEKTLTAATSAVDGLTRLYITRMC